MTIIAGEPGTGKTSLLLQLADDIARQGMPALFVSLEIAPPQLIAKSLARMSGGELSVADISRATQQAGEADARRESLSRAIRHYQQLIAPHIAFATATDAVEIGAMVAECERVREAKPVVFLDYVQALTSDAADADERLAIKGIVGSLRHAANSHEVPLFAISSVNRTSYDKPATGLSCLGGSSAVEYCSDSVAFLGIDGKGVERRTNMSRPIRPLKLAMLKNRYGTCDETTLLYDAEHAASAFMETGRSTWAGASVAASNSSCDTRCDTPDEKAASEATLDGAGGLRAAIRNALRPLAARPPEADAGPGEPEPDGGGPVPRIQEPVDMEETAQATRTISVRLTDDDFQLIQERCRAHGVSRSDYIRQLARVDAVTGDVGARRVLVLDRTTMLAVAKEMRAWGRHYNQAVHALNVMAKYLRNA